MMLIWMGHSSSKPFFFCVSLPKIGAASVRRRNGRWLFSYMRWIEAMEILHSHHAGQDHLSIFSFFPLSQMNLHYCHRWQWMNPRKVTFVIEPVIYSLCCLRRCYSEWTMNLAISKCVTVDWQRQNGHQLDVLSTLLGLWEIYHVTLVPRSLSTNVLRCIMDSLTWVFNHSEWWTWCER